MPKNQQIQNSSIVILGTARNVSKYIHKSVDSLLRIGSYFKECNFIVVESYSSDATLESLNELAKKYSNFQFVSLKPIQPMPTLSVRIAEARNVGLHLAKDKFPNVDYVFVADLDKVNWDLKLEGILSCWNYENWDMMSANQGFRYYDIWALRHPILSPGDCWRNVEYLERYFPRKVARKIGFKNRVIKIPANSKPIEVISAFGGFSIYSSNLYFQSQYSGIDDNGNEICEHVPMNMKMLSLGSKMFINPAMINLSRNRQISGMIKTYLRFLKF